METREDTVFIIKLFSAPAFYGWNILLNTCFSGIECHLLERRGAEGQERVF